MFVSLLLYSIIIRLLQPVVELQLLHTIFNFNSVEKAARRPFVKLKHLLERVFLRFHGQTFGLMRR